MNDIKDRLSEVPLCYEKCELFSDFIQSLFMIVFDTYLGDEITNATDKKNHYKWCWDKNVSNFKTEGIILGDYKTFDYFSYFLHKTFYPMSKKSENKKLCDNLIKIWQYMFDFDNKKNQADLNVALDVYEMLDNSMKID